ncbi:MAG: hypothetical protein HZC36_00320 [Armatimonadetes bacterium]|nr:hypothetical protein [Armatimonadota bacterium]
MSKRQKFFVLLCALAGAIVFGRFASPMLEWLYKTIMVWVPSAKEADYRHLQNPANISAISLIGLSVGAAIARVIVVLFARLGHVWDDIDTGDRLTLFLGIFAGLIASMPFLFLLNSLSLVMYIPLAVVGLTMGFSGLAVFALKSMDEILPWSKGRAKSRRKSVKILDTNVLIDGRIYDLARTGFLEAQLYVPGFVLEELQYIADSHDALRRQRGKRGLDILRHLQADFSMEIRVHDKLAPDLGDGVDARLVRLARAMAADIVTNDFNLNRVASLQQVRVLNINDLALALKPNVLPQETLTLPLVREGNQSGQAVGFLEDGTMVVVESGRDHIGETMTVTVTQVIQTERGKMIFAEVGGAEGNQVEGYRRRNGTRKY